MGRFDLIEVTSWEGLTVFYFFIETLKIRDKSYQLTKPLNYIKHMKRSYFNHMSCLAIAVATYSKRNVINRVRVRVMVFNATFNIVVYI